MEGCVLGQVASVNLIMLTLPIRQHWYFHGYEGFDVGIIKANVFEDWLGSKVIISQAHVESRSLTVSCPWEYLSMMFIFVAMATLNLAHEDCEPDDWKIAMVFSACGVANIG
jgi:hypothetical protein